MYISDIRIENFRLFGAGADAFQLSLKPGLTALVGENDAGKTAVIDALRFVLGTRDQESMRLELTDFHHSPSGNRSGEIAIRLTFSGLTGADRSAFAEYLTYLDGASPEAVMILTWVAHRVESDGFVRRFMPIEWRTGDKADGPLLDAGARFLLQATYLRPLRDAERAMSAGRGSRLSQILQHTKDIRDHGQKFDPSATPPLDPSTLSVLGLGDYSSHLIENSRGVQGTRRKLNEDYLQPLSFSGAMLNAWLMDQVLRYAKAHRHPEQRDRTIWEMFEAERSSLVPYAGRFDGFHALPASVSKTCLVRFDNNKYSVIASAVGRPVEIRAYADRIELRQDGRLVGEHPRCYGRDQTIYDPWHYVPVLARKPGALRNGAPFKDWVLPGAIDRVRRKLAAVQDGDRQMVEILTAVLSDGLPAVEAACADALRQGVHSADVIINILARRREPAAAITIMTPDALRLRHEPAADCARYDSLRRAV